MQGRIWKNKYGHIKDKIILPFFLYYDDFEPGNSLGSHGGAQALGAIYAALPFLPSHLVAKLNKILVTNIFNTKHRKKFGNKAVCKKLIEDINKICENGISVKVDDKGVKFFFLLLFIFRR